MPNIRTRTHEVKWKYVEFAVGLKVAAMTDFLPKPRARGGGRGKKRWRGRDEGEGRRRGGTEGRRLTTSTGCGDECRCEEAFLEKENCKMSLRGHGEGASGYSLMDEAGEGGGGRRRRRRRYRRRRRGERKE